MLVLFVPSSSLALSASLKVDGSAGAVGSWDKAALLKGYQNSAELPAREVTCAELPQDLVGTYYRNAPQRFTGYDGRKVRHPFDADGMVTAVTLDGRRGKAVVRQRYVATDGAVAERESGKTLFPGQFGNPLPFWSGGSNFKNLANTNVLAHGGKLLALWEGSRPHLLDPLSLATEGEWTVGGLVGEGPTDGFSAHPRRTENGGVANFAYFGSPVTGKTTVKFWEFGPDSFEPITPPQTHEVDGFGLYHDFLVTDSYFIITAAPCTWGPGGLDSLRMTAEWVAGKRPVTSMICFDETRPTVLHLFPRDASKPGGREPISIELDTFFSFHHANAWEEEGGDVVCFDTVRTDKLVVDDSSLTASNSDAAEALSGGGNRFVIEDIDYAEDVPRVTLMRYEVNLRSGAFSKRSLSPRHVEFPSVSRYVERRRHRYVYSTPGADVERVSPQAGVLKTDCDEPAHSQIWLPQPHEFCGEVLFAPRAAGGGEGGGGGGGGGGGDGGKQRAEDDGYLLTLCFDGKAGTSSLLIFDARRVSDGPICRMPLAEDDETAGALPEDAQIRGPGHGLHAAWLPGVAPSLEAVQAAEDRRGMKNARFLSDAPRRG